MAVATSGSAVLTMPEDTQILIEREFDAPAHLVFRAWTTPELVKKWWSAKRGAVTVAEIDLQVGGKWRSAMVTDDGFEVAFHGEYREIVPNERLVSTEVYEMPGVDPAETEANATINTLTLVEAEGRTKATILIECPSQQVRDMIIESGMEGGLQDALDLLEQEVIALKD